MKIKKIQHIYTAINSNDRIVGTAYFSKKFPFVHINKRPVTGNLPDIGSQVLEAFRKEQAYVEEIKRTLDKEA